MAVELAESPVTKANLLNNVAVALRLMFTATRSASPIEEAVLAYEQAVALVADGHANKPLFLNNLANAHLSHYEVSSEIRDLEKALTAVEAAMLLNPEADPQRVDRLSTLGQIHYTMFLRSHERAGIDKAISSLQAAVDLAPDGYLKKSGFLTNLGNAYQKRFDHFGDVSDIRKGIEVLWSITHLTPDDHPEKHLQLGTLGGAYQSLFTHTQDLSDLGQAISLKQRAADLCVYDDYNKMKHLNNLANALQIHSQIHSGQIGDSSGMTAALAMRRKAVQIAPAGTLIENSVLLSNLAGVLEENFEHTLNLPDIEDAISIQEKAVEQTPISHADRPVRLAILANAYRLKFLHTSKLAESEKAIDIMDHVLAAVPRNHPRMVSFLQILGTALDNQFEQTGHLAESDRAVNVLEQAVELSEKGSMDAIFSMSNLGVALDHRFQHIMNISDIDRALVHKQTALSLIPQTHKHLAKILSNLGISYLLRYDRLHNPADIEEAIEYQKFAVEKTDVGSAQMATSLSNLGTAYQTHYQHAQEVTYLQEAISCYQRAIASSLDDATNLAIHLNNHGAACLEYAKHTGLLSYLDEAINSLEKAVGLVPDGHAMKPAYLGNLANAHFHYYQKDDTQYSHAETGIELMTHAVQLTPEHHARKVECYHDLGNKFFVQYQHTLDKNDLHFAIVYHHAAATAFTGSIATRFAAAKMWAHCAFQDSSLHDECLEAYSWACSLLPKLIWLGQNMTEQYRQILSLQDFVNEAASIAIMLNKLDTAVEWLEQGRSIVWNQLLQLRAHYEELDEQYPELAKELRSAAQALEKESISQSNANIAQSSVFLHEAAAHHHQLAERWEYLLREVQAKPGFHTFLKPKSFRDIHSACKNGPVIMVNVHRLRCDALILVSGQESVVHVALENFTSHMGSEMQHALHGVILQTEVQMRETRQSRQAKLISASGQPKHSLRAILAILWHHVAQPIIQALGLQCLPDEQKAHCWWCVTGPLAMLPIHAAGLYDGHSPSDQVSSYMVSSYTPTLASLTASLHAEASEFKGLLMIAQPQTPGQPPLYFAAEEQSVVMRHMDACHTLNHYLSGSAATIEAVLDGLSTCSWVHMACHGTQNLLEPTKSAFCLHDGSLELSALITKSIPHAELAILSACQTATGAANLSEEAVHLAAGMLFAGFKSVIATMWSIRDEDAPIIVEEVYSYLCKDNRPHGSKSALALHVAVNRLREEIGVMDDAALLAWVPFIHVGL
ncbi:CHAT domain-containing protein [Rhodofomes roseus]|uniref:CHAT domain-containing protein n=1 Tax=Rhodofomes roseus TaxID=34475 RepID=A0ABQ8KBU7_9APHY|nr:CHAT domain-containing protein [Rhodofomes roseus]KAH9834461.1 CHAT domain-containing protein [Rhodofomes roseus]